MSNTSFYRSSLFSLQPQLEQKETAKFLCGTFFLGAVASTWLVNLLQFARLKR